MRGLWKPYRAHAVHWRHNINVRGFKIPPDTGTNKLHRNDPLRIARLSPVPAMVSSQSAGYCTRAEITLTRGGWDSDGRGAALDVETVSVCLAVSFASVVFVEPRLAKGEILENIAASPLV